MNISTDSSLTGALEDKPLLARRPCNTTLDREISSSAETIQQKRMKGSRKRVSDEDSDEGGDDLPEGEGCGDEGNGDRSPLLKKRRVDDTKTAELDKGGSSTASQQAEGEAPPTTNNTLQDGRLEVFFLEPLPMPQTALLSGSRAGAALVHGRSSLHAASSSVHTSRGGQMMVVADGRMREKMHVGGGAGATDEILSEEYAPDPSVLFIFLFPPLTVDCLYVPRLCALHPLIDSSNVHSPSPKLVQVP
ncbi:hypothetical protein EW146_g3720 [Bondarzewia mesenterica]|uniref:Uncharacterized protein n=1 Tax=Bondarzewia mesenterica TaxID=1095465 RepID=A0A4S4M2I9_9AGAM|nr:hypothetical protein EW146_g3720 [Bondarzewia mesenterica]